MRAHFAAAVVVPFADDASLAARTLPGPRAGLLDPARLVSAKVALP